MTTRARAEYDPYTSGVRIVMVGGAEGGARLVKTWPPAEVRVIEPGVEPPPDSWLRMDEDEARAVYSALAQYFGFAPVDAQHLRRDYDAERRRVDKMIDALIGRSS